MKKEYRRRDSRSRLGRSSVVSSLGRRDFLKTGMLTSAGVLLSGACAKLAQQGSMPKPLNVFIYVTHDSGRHFGCYGEGRALTPRIDRMAGEGVLFSNHFATAAGCSPSRGAIFTGRYPHNNGLMGLANRGWGFRIHPSEKHMARLFNESGYRTTLFSIQHEIDRKTWPDFAREMGYEQHLGQREEAATLPPLVIQELKKWAEHSDGRPFFAAMGTEETHRPFPRRNYPFPVDDPDRCWVPPYLPDTPDVRRDFAAFHSLFGGVDNLVGNIMDTLDETGLSENTLFVLTTDHGIPYPRAKCTLYDSGIETALIIRGPGAFRGGKIIDELVSNVDVLPTILEAAGIPVPKNIQGRSVLPLLEGRSYKPRREIFAEKTFHGYYDPKRCIRTKRFKYIRNWKLDQQMEMGDACKLINEGKDLRDLFPKEHPPEELYDLAKDPYELENVVGRPEYQSTRSDLRSRLMDFLKATDDPILEGRVPHPDEPRVSRYQLYYES